MDRVPVREMNSEPTLTKQAMASEMDINSIVARHVAHGLPFYPSGRAQYGDFSNGLDFHSALNAIRSAEEDFMRLPASVRDHCNNDPGRFLDLVSDVSRRDELVKLGLVPEAVPASAGGPGGGVGVPPATPPAGAGSPPGGVP